MSVVLGVAGAYVSPGDPVDAFTTKVGGQARWFPGIYPTPAQLRCRSCGQGPMRLLVQAYAPLHLPSMDLDEKMRTLYVYVCEKKSCFDQETGWKVFRAQSALVVSPAATSNEPTKDLVDGWEDRRWEDDSTCGDESLEALMSGLDVMAAKGKNARNLCQEPDSTLITTAADRASTNQNAFPEYYIVCEEENREKYACEDEKHVLKLLERYQREHTEFHGSTTEEHKPVHGWSGEVYEKGESGTVSSKLLKFLRTLDSCPAQCIRYGFRGKPLWPVVPVPQPGPCPACAGPRVFEMQLMPAMIHDLQGAVTSDQSNMECDECLEIPSGWYTVGIWTCARSCRSMELIEESIKLAQEGELDTSVQQ